MALRKQIGFIALAVLLCAGGIFYGVLRPPVKPVFEMYDPQLAAGTEMPVFYVNTERKALALTFDISWGDKIPIKVLMFYPSTIKRPRSSYPGLGQTITRIW